MDHARWNQIEDLLQAALDREPAQRAAFLDEACGNDTDLRREVESLLAAEANAGLLSGLPVIVRDAPDLTGQTISNYYVERRIGMGGMGEVYEARDDRLQRVVALKALTGEFTRDADRVRRFEQEAFAASRLNHPNIITIFEIVHSEGSHFIAAERVDGKTLRDLLSDGAMPPEKALDIAIQIASALKAAHTAWIIHRDIKPENIMVRSDGLVKVLDFGIAKLAEEVEHRFQAVSVPAASPSNLTTPGAVLGTASYMSPEQARGDPLDGRTDIYSLGLVLYEVLSGQRLFSGSTRADDPLALRGRMEQVPRELQPVVRKMLRPDRDDRYSSTADLLTDLHAIRRRIDSRSARRMVALGVLAVVVALAVAGIAAMLSVSETWSERVLRDGHTAAARQVVSSPDGRTLVSCGEDGNLIVWDVARRERLATLQHAAEKLVFAPDGKWFASGGVDGTIVIWDAATRKRIRTLQGHAGIITALSLAPRGNVLMSSSAGIQTIAWDTRSWAQVGRWPEGGGHGNFVFSSDGQVIVASGNLTAMDLVSTQVTPQDERYGANWIALAPDSSLLAAIDTYGNVAFYRVPDRDLRRLQFLARFKTHQDHGRAIAFSPDGRLVASAAENIVLWDATTRQKLARFESSAIVWSVTFSADGRWLLSSHADGSILIWDVAERARAASLNEHIGAVRAVAFSNDGRHVVSGGEDRSAIVWRLDPLRKGTVFAEHGTRVTGVRFVDDNSVASVDINNLLFVWNAATGKARLAIEPEPEMKPVLASYTVDAMRDGRAIATSYGVYASSNGRIVLDFYSSGQAGRWFYGQHYGVAFSADNRRLATVTDGGWVLLWDVAARRMMGKVKVEGTHQISVTMSADAKWIVTGEDEGAVRLWSAEPLREVATIGRHRARVKSVAFSPDGKTVASAGDDKMVILWDVKSRKERARIGTHASPVYAVAFSPDGRRLVSGEHDGSVRVYTRKRELWGFNLE